MLPWPVWCASLSARQSSSHEILKSWLKRGVVSSLRTFFSFWFSSIFCYSVVLLLSKSIYYITGQNQISLQNSPLLEMYDKKDIEVLILDDEIDEIIITGVPKYDDKELKSVNRSGAADDFSDDSDKFSLVHLTIPLATFPVSMNPSSAFVPTYFFQLVGSGVELDAHRGENLEKNLTYLQVIFCVG